MANIFIYDASPDRIRTLTICLKDNGHDVLSNMDNIQATKISSKELIPSRAIREMYVKWSSLPDFIITDCFDVDCEDFLEVLHSPFFKKEPKVIVMAPDTVRENSLLKRLMSRFDVVCMPRPFVVNKFIQFVDEITV